MLLYSSLLWSGLAACAIAAPEALVYLFDKESSQAITKTPSISPREARLLFAKRLELSHYHELGRIDDHLLEVLNSYGSGEQTIFAPRDDQAAPFLFIEGVEHPEDVMGDIRIPTLSIKESPPRTSTKQLSEDFAEQSGLELGARQPSVLYDTKLEDLQRESPAYKSALAEVKQTIKSLFQTSTSGSILITPPTRFTKDTASYYPRSTLQKRKQPTQEEVLSAEDDDEPSETTTSASASSTSPSESSTATPTALPHGILPLCQKTLSEAISVTNNCSGHGTPYRKSAECFACKCSTTVLKTSEGKTKTVHWGGPACQKKDVSMPFFLLAGITLLLVGVSAWGVGLLVSMGNEELPSVIGAGVSGPRAQK